MDRPRAYNLYGNARRFLRARGIRSRAGVGCVDKVTLEPSRHRDERTARSSPCLWCFLEHDLPLDSFDLGSDAVRGRFRAALSRGDPQWLWPEVTVDAWQAALFQIARTTSDILATGGARTSLEGEADAIGIAAFTSGMGPMLGYWSMRQLFDADVSVHAILQLHYRHNCRRMERLARHGAKIVERLATAGLSVTILKGMHTAYSYFPTPGTRPVSDIDLLIEPQDEPAAAEVLRKLGYEPGIVNTGEQSWHMSGTPREPRSLSLTHQDSPWTIDLHTSLDRQYSPGAPMIRLDEVVGRCVPDSWPITSKGTVLPPPELTLHLAFHASTPFVSLSMVRLTELVLVLESVKRDGRLDWDAFLSLAQQTGAASSVYPALHFADALVPGRVPAEVLMALEEQAPTAVRRVVRRLTPATCQRMRRCSLEERFMWTNGLRSWVREIVTDVFPCVDPRRLLDIYAMRFWRLARGTVSR